MVHIQRKHLKDGNDEYLVPEKIVVTDGEKAWSGKCDAQKDSVIKGTTAKEFWAAVACAFRKEPPTKCAFATSSLRSHFDPASGTLKVEWEIQYDDNIVLKNSWKTRLSPEKESESIKVEQPTVFCSNLFPLIASDLEFQKLAQSSASALLQQRINHENRIITLSEELDAVKTQRQAFERSVKEIAERCRAAACFIQYACCATLLFLSTRLRVSAPVQK